MPNEVEQINPTTYRIRLVEDEVEIGDIEAPVFIPHAKVKRWGGECFLSIKPAGEITEVELEIEQYKVKSKYKTRQNGFDLEVESELEGLDPDANNELGAFELNIVLPKKPPTNRLVFDIETQDLAFHYQPPLTQEEIDEGGERPENVVGSYAVYHATKRDHAIGQTNYMAGKAFHIYRSRIEDANNNWVWGELSIDTQAGTLTVAIPQAFLNIAVYPIRHAAGLTFGHTGIGASGAAHGGNTLRGYHPHAPAFSGTVTMWHAYHRDGGVQCEVRPVLYKNSDDSLVGVGAEKSSAVLGWWDQALACAVVGATVYIISIWISNTNNWGYNYDAVAGFFVAKDTQAYHATNDPPNPIDWDAGKQNINTQKVSAYCDYTPAAAGGGGGGGLASAAARVLLT